KLVRPPGREDFSAGSRESAPLAPVHCAPKASPFASSPNCPSLHHCERGSPMKNRKREICTSRSVRDEDGQPPHLLRRPTFLHLAAGAAALPAVSRAARAQAYPSRPVYIIVGFPPSGPGNIVTRLMGQQLSERLGQPFVIARYSLCSIPCPSSIGHIKAGKLRALAVTTATRSVLPDLPTLRGTTMSSWAVG